MFPDAYNIYHEIWWKSKKNGGRSILKKKDKKWSAYIMLYMPDK